jgi:hypothetical protein
MFCKQNQEIIDRLLRLKDSSIDNKKIASLLAKPDSQSTREDNELTVHIIEEIIQNGNNKELINNCN